MLTTNNECVKLDMQNVLTVIPISITCSRKVWDLTVYLWNGQIYIGHWFQQYQKVLSWNGYTFSWWRVRAQDLEREIRWYFQIEISLTDADVRNITSNSHIISTTQLQNTGTNLNSCSATTLWSPTVMFFVDLIVGENPKPLLGGARVKVRCSSVVYFTYSLSSSVDFQVIFHGQVV